MLYSIVKACLGAASQQMAHSNMALPSAALCMCSDQGLQNTPRLHTAPQDKSDQHFAK